MGAGCWSLLFLLGLLLIELQQRLGLSRVWLLGSAVVLALLLGWLAGQGWLEPLALLLEYQARRRPVAAAPASPPAPVGAAGLLVRVPAAPRPVRRCPVQPPGSGGRGGGRERAVRRRHRLVAAALSAAQKGSIGLLRFIQ